MCKTINMNLLPNENKNDKNKDHPMGLNPSEYGSSSR
jgi:hypothetical protein